MLHGSLTELSGDLGIGFVRYARHAVSFRRVVAEFPFFFQNILNNQQTIGKRRLASGHEISETDRR